MRKLSIEFKQSMDALRVAIVNLSKENEAMKLKLRTLEDQFYQHKTDVLAHHIAEG